MEATALIQAIEKLRETFAEPPSYMEVVRHSVMSQLARTHDIQVPPLLSDTQRKVFLDNIDQVAGFLKSEDGADSIELVVNAFTRFVDRCEEEKPS